MDTASVSLRSLNHVSAQYLPCTYPPKARPASLLKGCCLACCRACSAEVPGIYRSPGAALNQWLKEAWCNYCISLVLVGTSVSNGSSRATLCMTLFAITPLLLGNQTKTNIWDGRLIIIIACIHWVPLMFQILTWIILIFTATLWDKYCY